uniref:Antitoxin n=1 Tax=Candidatus Kentrum sp. FM TaxID=2126340 RepID=A0A450T0H1_9GAMM|nr:MAG: Antitoxin Phd_YefM, type II toxin-antitoxin system [Candidatus Kentron sp. FM]VFJ62801.1 MAG: Antitoxin Phd_YefM, type II toxin-antitoxin system [Candidatus Kentron sp. FM]VFK13072.1 MAG: Antitoxin Phd_YefM, type II toxin-antitoxin system [Candidatus Kentron sp. FM]
MQTAAFTEFRKNASALFSAVEAGEKIVVTRHGKAIAQILPPELAGTAAPSWKGERTRLTIPGKSLSKLIMEEREHAG